MKDCRFFYCQEKIPPSVKKPIHEALGNIDWHFIKEIVTKHNWGTLKGNMFWGSQAGCITQCHYDECHNLMAQCSGEKRFILFHPDNFDYMYPFPRHHPGDRQSQVNWYAPQPDWFPLYSQATAMETTLYPGDVVCFSIFISHIKSTSLFPFY